MRKQLAIEGGNRIFSQPPPDFNSSADRTFGLAGEALVIETLRSGCLSRNGGTIVAGLERDFAETLGVAHCVACSSETSSVHLTIAALDLDPGDEVIVLPITDIGSILPVL